MYGPGRGTRILITGATILRFSQLNYPWVEQVARIELASQPWQGRIITAILYLHMEQYTGFEPVPSAWKAEMLAIKHQYCIGWYERVGTIHRPPLYQSGALPTELRSYM